MRLSFPLSCLVCFRFCDEFSYLLLELLFPCCFSLAEMIPFSHIYRNNGFLSLRLKALSLEIAFFCNPCLQILNFHRQSFFSSDLNFCNPLNKTSTCSLSDNKVFHILSTELFSSLSFPHSACLQKFSCNFPSNTDRPCVT